MKEEWNVARAMNASDGSTPEFQKELCVLADGWNFYDAVNAAYMPFLEQLRNKNVGGSVLNFVLDTYIEGQTNFPPWWFLQWLSGVPSVVPPTGAAPETFGGADGTEDLQSTVAMLRRTRTPSALETFLFSHWQIT